MCACLVGCCSVCMLGWVLFCVHVRKGVVLCACLDGCCSVCMFGRVLLCVHVW